ncbi:spore germination protein [Ferviditalea candida]|uniref:Spore germination protein n=1 Tax=Ferviditalea candida TaxID=3108399 RepID=A0ABU5ZQ23_9BACL|nr:spore germination protein [Paenibacillaceae bacterium T2]
MFSLFKRFLNKSSAYDLQSKPQSNTDTESSLLNENSLIENFRRCSDVKHHRFKLNAMDEQSAVLMLYCEGLSDSQQFIHEIAVPRLNEFYKVNGFASAEAFVSSSQLQLETLPVETWRREAVKHIFEGKLLLYIPAFHTIFSLDISKKPARKPEQSNIEVSIRGAKDGFVEELATNAGLIRKRVKSSSMAYETRTVGVRTQTAIGIFYLYDIVDPQIVADIHQKLDNIQIDGIFSATQLEEMMSPTRALFPLMAYTGRPDFTVNCIMNGRVAIIVDGTPAALIVPANLFLLVKTPEDIHFTALSATFGQALRLLGLVISLILPAFWVAILGYHQEQLPYFLLATIGVNRLGIPLDIAGEIFLALLFLEILREAGTRLPSAVGSTITVVGGLIIGDAAIRAGFLSPSIVVIGAITHVFGATLSSQALAGTISILRFFMFFLAAILGIYGFFLGLFILITHLSTLRSCGIPYLAPISPPFKDFANALLRLPWNWKKKRPEMLNPQDPRNQGEQP